MSEKLAARRKEILKLLSQVPISSTQQLAAETDVSTETMRKDLDALADEGLIIKVHGGVALAGGHVNEIPFDLRARRNVAEKRRIAQTALNLLKPDDSIVLEGCTTNLELAKALGFKPELLGTLVIITNSFSIASALEFGRKCRKLFFLGGWVNPQQYGSHGYQTTQMLSDFHVNKAFISGAALTDEYVLTGYYDDDVAFQKMAIQSASETILMIDSSKFGQAAILSVAHLSAVDWLVTDKALEKEAIRTIGAMDVKVLVAE